MGERKSGVRVVRASTAEDHLLFAIPSFNLPDHDTTATMATPSTPRLFTSFVCQSCRQRLLPSTRRNVSTTSALRAEQQPPPSASRPDSALAGLSALGSNLSRNTSRRNGLNDTRANPTKSIMSALDADSASFLNAEFGKNLDAAHNDKPYKMHVYATKHNTHITFVQPTRPASQTASSGVSGTSASAADQKKMVDVLLSLSTGNIGFRKAGRGSYDAAYQLAAFALKQMQEKGMLRDVAKLEVVLRGFGAGREAVTKALLGAEGRSVRGKISGVVDATRLKHGGPRSKKPRRLG